MSPHLHVSLQNARLERAGRVVLHGIDWQIRPGERWVLVGGNGAGKTQLMKLVAGDVWPAPTRHSSRVYHWRGEIWPEPREIKEEIAYVGAERQDKYDHYEWNLRVRQIVGTGIYRTDIPLNPLSRDDAGRIDRVLTRLGIRHLASRRFLSLSYGERRLTLLARALASRPKLLLLDEIFNGLDTSYRARMSRWLESTAPNKLPWVLATHRAEDIPRSATHALVLEEGQARYQGPLRRKTLDAWLIHPEKVQSVRAAPEPGGALLVRFTRASAYLDGTSVLRDISFELRAGECWVVHGPNGSGKSTLLRAVYGNQAVAGNVMRAGIAPGVPLESFKKQVGWVAPQLQTDHPLYLTATEVIQSGRHASIGLNDAPSVADRKAARRVLSLFGLDALAKTSLRELSYGQVRVVLFARAWVSAPKLLLLDEPFSGIDAPTRRVLLERIECAIRNGVAVMMATHHRHEWPAGVTHELALNRGRAVYCGPAR